MKEPKLGGGFRQVSQVVVEWDRLVDFCGVNFDRVGKVGMEIDFSVNYN